MGQRDESTQVEAIYNYQDEHDAVTDNNGFIDRISVALSQIFQPVYNSLFAGRGNFVSNLEIKLAQARINRAVEIWMSQAIAVGTIAGAVVGIFVGGALLLIGLPGVRVVGEFLPTGIIPDAISPDRVADELWVDILLLIGDGILNGLFVAFWVMLFSIFGIIGGLGYAIYRPEFTIWQRKQAIDTVMPDIVSIMHSLSIGGTDTLDIFRAVADSEDVYGEAALEFRRLTTKIDDMNKDYRTAIRETAATTPNEQLSGFLNDMLSIINSGGDLDLFLEEKKNEHIEQRKKDHEKTLETLEFFGEVYITLTIFPLLMLVILVMMAFFGNAQSQLLLLTVYVLIPALNIGYLISVATITPDPVGTGKLDPPSTTSKTFPDKYSLFDISIVKTHAKRSASPVFDKVLAYEIQHQLNNIVSNPKETLTNSPPYTLLFTVPLTLGIIALLISQGIAKMSLTAFTESGLVQSFVWFGVPFFVTMSPLAFFYERRRRHIGSITETLTTDLGKMANANASGRSLLESIKIAGDDNPSLLGKELRSIYKQVKFRSTLGEALIKFNNTYRVPRLARTLKLIHKSQETSSHIPEVLRTAANLSRIEDELAEEKRNRSRMQVVVVMLGFFVFLGVLIMMDQYFLETISDLVGENQTDQGQFAEFGAIDQGFLSLLYIHTTIIQAFFGGLVAGYMREDDLVAGIKYSIAFVAITFVAWGSTFVIL